jgi:hypothetical protein
MPNLAIIERNKVVTRICPSNMFLTLYGILEYLTVPGIRFDCASGLNQRSAVY